MTQKLYEQNAYTVSFEATVIACEPHKERYRVVLDQTAFFPEGGGQASDGGTLNGLAVIDVQERGGTIFHTVDQPIEVGMTVSGEIDWQTRFSRMQNHSGEHLLSGLIYRGFGYHNVGFHMGSDGITLDVDGVLSREELAELERQANEAVFRNVPIRAYYPEKSVLETLDYRSKLDLTENVRLVEIEGYDLCACCAPHVARTGEIGLIKVLNACPNKGGTRIRMLCGYDALQDYGAKTHAQAEIMKLLSAPEDQTVAAVQRTLQSLAAAKAEIKELKEKLALAGLKTEQINGITVGFADVEGFDELRACAETLLSSRKGICALFSLKDETGMFVVIAEEDVGALVTYLKTQLNAKGGGKPHYVQGKITATAEEIRQALAAYTS